MKKHTSLGFNGLLKSSVQNKRHQKRWHEPR